MKLENTGTHEVRNFTTSSSGSYTFTSLQPGSYTVTVTMSGFKTFEAKVTLAGGDRVRVDASLAIGSEQQTIEVTAVTSALQTDSTNVGTTITGKSLQDIPLNGRNYLTLVTISPGVNAGNPSSLVAGNRLNDRRPSSAISANGQSELLNNELIDGLDNNGRFSGNILVRPSIEAIQQVRTDTNLYTAEVGRTAGAAINVITKSGENAFHGSVYDYLRNDITDARNFFAPASSGPKPLLRRNQFGASLSGPILHDRTFFFVDYEGTHSSDANNSVYISTVPTLFEQQNPGNLSDIGGTVVPVSAINATTLAYFKLFPAPNQMATSSSAGIPINNFFYNPAARQTSSLGDLRIDQHFGEKDSIYGRYSYNRTLTLTPAYVPPINGIQSAGVVSLPAPGNSTIITHNVQINYTHIFTPSLVMELKAGYTLFNNQSLPFNYGRNLNDSPPYSIPNANECFICSGLATISIASATYAALGDPTQAPLMQSESPYLGGASMVYTHGQQTFKFGATLIRRHVSDVQGAMSKGFIQFTASTPQTALANFFKGTPFTYRRNTQISKPYDRTWESAAYVQDDWHVTRDLTLNMGIRYDVFTAPNEANGNLANFNLNTLQMMVNNTGGVNTDFANIAPRFGFAYSVARNTVLRGGFGLTYYASDIQKAFQLDNPPYQFDTGSTSSTAPISAGIAPVTSGSTATANLRGAVTTKPVNFRDAYVEQFNLLLQRDLSGTVFTLGYVGELGRHLMEQIGNLNLPAPAGPSPANAPAPAAPYAKTLPNVNTILAYEDFGSSSYNSFQISVERRLFKGFSTNINYTHAHALDDVNNQADGEATFGLQPSIIGQYDYGNSFLDVPDRLAGFFTYQLPLGRSGAKLYKAVAGGWQLNGLGFWQVGSPISVSDGYTQNGRAQINLKTVTADRPDRIASTHLANSGPGSNNLAFNIAAFALQPLGTAGNAGRNQLRGFSKRRGDLSVFKTIPVKERLHAEFRAECFNFTNTPNFDDPGSQITAFTTSPVNGRLIATDAKNFGHSTNTPFGFSGRQFQFALKLLF